VSQFEELLDGVPVAQVGTVNSGRRLIIRIDESHLLDAQWMQLKEAWQAPLRW